MSVTVEVLEERIDALARLSDERFQSAQTAVSAALAAAEKATNAAFAAAKEAVTKAEEAQQRVNVGQNEFRGAMNDLADSKMPRIEADLRFTALENQVASLTSSRDTGMGRERGIGLSVSAVVTVLTLGLGLVTAIVYILTH